MIDIFRIDEDSLYFKGTGAPDNKTYEVTINFHKKINPKQVESKNSGRCYEFVIVKAETNAPYWPSLTNDKKKPHWLKVDFNKWKDEGSDDEEAQNEMGGMGGMGGGAGGMGNFNDLMGSMGGMGGMGGMGDMMSGMGGMGDKPSFDDLEGEEDSDDEEIPDLEEASKK